MYCKGGERLKAFYIPLAILISILLFSLITGAYVQRCAQEWNFLLEACDEFLQQDQWENSETLLREALNDWEKRATLFHMFLDHEALENIDLLFSGAFAACRQQERSDLQIFLYQLKSQFLFLADTQRTTLKNIL